MADEWIMYGTERDDPECIYIKSRSQYQKIQGSFYFPIVIF